MRVFLLTSAALVGFAANSLLTRSALATGRIDAASFTAVRLISGALILWLLARRHTIRPRDAGSWPSAVALAGYAIAFTLAYRHIGAGIGALTLFGAVQVTMILRGWREGERPGPREVVGLGLALAGLATLTLPGAAAPNLAGLTLMVLAGISWGIYSLRGRRTTDPLAATAGNFLRASPFGLAFVALSARGLAITPAGVALAAASGAIASGIGYALWYAALPALTAWRAAVVQLSVPVITALAAAALLGEALTARLESATGLILSGVVLSVWRRRAR